MNRFFAPALALLAAASNALAHDSWIETNTSAVRAGDVVHIDLMLGNHGNEHRDFKFAGKVNLEKSTLAIVPPAGAETDLKPQAIDLGLGPKDGYWTVRYPARERGIYTVIHSSSAQHGTSRSLKFAKTQFAAVDRLDSPEPNSGFDVAVGQPLEIVPLTDPAQAAAGRPIQVRVLYKSEPLPQARISFVPRGQVLAAGVDPQFERHTDSRGEAEWTPNEGNVVLVVVHHTEPSEKGDGYDKTVYSATLTTHVSNVSP